MKLRTCSIGCVLLACSKDGTEPPASYLSREELMDPVTCASCHQQHYEEWASSMHAYASDDPIFIAMNQRGQREANIGDFCVQCHAPMAHRTGASTDGTNLQELPAALRGVTCYFCHSVAAVDGTHNNPLVLAEDDVMRGQLADPVPNEAHRSTYSPLHDRDRLESAELCGTCHDIVNDRGTHIERTFAEWQASVFSQPEIGTTCGQCHMDQSTTLQPAAQAPGVFSRRTHDHRFPGVDLPLIAAPGAEELAQAVQSFLNTSLQSALCVRGAPGGFSLQVVLDNVAGGHSFPSGSAQDRRAWIELVAYAAGEVIYQSGRVPAGTSVTDLADPDLWLIRDCIFDERGGETHSFWAAADYESNLLPAQVTFDPSDPRFYESHVYRTYPNSGMLLPFYPDRVTLQVHLQPIGLDVFDDLVESGDLVDTSEYQVADLRARLVPLSVGEELVWTETAATEVYVEGGLPVMCVSTTNLSARADKVPAVDHARCAP